MTRPGSTTTVEIGLRRPRRPRARRCPTRPDGAAPRPRTRCRARRRGRGGRWGGPGRAARGAASSSAPPRRGWARGSVKLRPDVAAQPHAPSGGAARPPALYRTRRLVEGHAELVVLEARRDVRVRLRIDVRVHPDADRRRPVHPGGHALEVLELGLRLDVEEADAGLEGLRPSPPRSCPPRRTPPWPGSPPAAITRWSSPPETMSKPAPCRARRSSTPTLGQALTAKHTRCSRGPSRPRPSPGSAG